MLQSTKERVTLPDAATVGDVLSGFDPDDVLGNADRLRDAGFDDDPAGLAMRHKTLAKLASVPTDEKQTDREVAVRIAESADLFRDTNGKAFARINVNGHTETVPVKSPRFRHWLSHKFRDERGKVPAADSKTAAVEHALGVAEFNEQTREVFVRIGHAENRSKIYVDLCDATWRVVEIDADGWRILDEAPVPLFHAEGMLPLPTPERGGSLSLLRRYVNAEDEATWKLLLGFLVGTTMPDGPYVHLSLHGRQGSSKSTTTRMLREVIDPNAAPIRSQPKTLQDLSIAAHRSRMLALDNLSHIDQTWSDAFCRLSTGGGFSTRTLYEDDGETVFYGKRPVIFNGISELATKGDLIDRMIVLELPPLGDRHTDEDRLYSAFKADHPKILGGLLDATAQAIRNREAARASIERLPRMADFAIWVEAASGTLGMEPGEFLALYNANKETARETEIESSVFATAVVRVVQAQSPWVGSATELLRAAAHYRSDDRAKDGWPATPKAAANALRRVAPALADVHGITYEPPTKINGTRKLTLTKATTEGDTLSL